MDSNPISWPRPGQEPDESTSGVDAFRAALRAFIAVAAFVGLLVADGVLLWVFLVILIAAVVSLVPLAFRSRRRVQRDPSSQPARVPPPPTGSALAPLPSGDRRVVLDVVGPKKIQVIKVVKEIYGIRLAEAKALVDNAPSVVAVGLSDHDARRVQGLLHAAGASARIDGPAP